MDSSVTIIVTGDHTIFRDVHYSPEMDKYAQKHKINFENGYTYTPLIISYLPHHTTSKRTNKQSSFKLLDSVNVTITEELYQMDIYPTIANMIGGNEWKGLGVDLLNCDSPSQKRTLSEEEAFIISNKLIRSNYFKNK